MVTPGVEVVRTALMPARVRPDDAPALSPPHAKRPFDQYLHFGFGARECFGRYIAEIVLLEVFRSLLLLKGLSRTTDAKGQLQFDGPVAAGLVVKF
jgi:cytochrome P450